MVMAAGIDQDQAADRVTLTVQILKPDEVKPPAGRMGGTEGSKGVWVAESSAKTIFDAVRNFAFVTARKLFGPSTGLSSLGRRQPELALLLF
ncbi:MAG: hypothetical protein H5U02_08620 [Clostridia bacterium]|nr:hypothetical protein [Clostridia bacterium]